MTPTQTDLIETAGISQTYASFILNGKRVPSRSLAIHLFKELGWRHECIADLTDAQIETLATVEPWVSPRDREAKAA